jgi:hypothetical protein
MALSEDEVRQLKVAELKTELSALGLSASGKKEELQERLLAALLVEKSMSACPPSGGNVSVSPSPNANSVITGSPGSDSSIDITQKSHPENIIASRAARFGMQSTAASSSNTDLGKVSSATCEDLLSLERLKKRQERFGASISSKLLEGEQEMQRQKRAQRFGDS